MAIENGILMPSGTLKLRGGTTEALASVNPTVSAREVMVETDTGKTKVGKGYWRNGHYFEYNWNDLPYSWGWMADELEGIETTVDKTALHNSIKARNYITKNEALTAIASGLKNIWAGTHIGDVNNGYIVLDINYFLDIGVTNTPHAVVAPYSNTVARAFLTSLGNFATDGYHGFTLLRSLLSDIADEAISYFGAGHVLTHNEYLCDGISNGEPSSYDWYETNCELMSGQQVYGNGFLGTGNLRNRSGYLQFSYFKLTRGLGEVTPGMLRDVASADSLWATGSEWPTTVTLEAGEESYLPSFTPYLCIY